MDKATDQGVASLATIWARGNPPPPIGIAPHQTFGKLKFFKGNDNFLW